jgi:hypothetical protein
MRVCNTCHQRAKCTQLCPEMERAANNNAPLREQLITPDIIEDVDQRPYGDALSELIEDQRNRDANRLDMIRAMPDTRGRLIAAGILAHIPQQNIASLMHIHQSTISRIYRIVTTS